MMLPARIRLRDVLRGVELGEAALDAEAVEQAWQFGEVHEADLDSLELAIRRVHRLGHHERIRVEPGSRNRDATRERHHQAVDFTTEQRAVDGAVTREVPLGGEVVVLRLGGLEVRIAASARAITDAGEILRQVEVRVEVDEVRTTQRLAVVEAKAEVLRHVVAQRDRRQQFVHALAARMSLHRSPRR